MTSSRLTPLSLTTSPPLSSVTQFPGTVNVPAPVVNISIGQTITGTAAAGQGSHTHGPCRSPRRARPAGSARTTPAPPPRVNPPAPAPRPPPPGAPAAHPAD